jgi:hypothetical protein
MDVPESPHRLIFFFLSRQTKIHGIGATLGGGGVDKYGNKYYEKLHDTQYGE